MQRGDASSPHGATCRSGDRARVSSGPAKRLGAGRLLPCAGRCLALSLILRGAAAHGGLQLAEKGEPAAQIVRWENADPAVQFAAEELQRWVREISGAELPIRGQAAAGRPSIVLGILGESPLLEPVADAFRSDAEQLAGNDGYAIREHDGAVYLLASVPKGVVNGVFRVLFRNTDIIWARPNPDFGTIYSKDPDLTFRDTDILDLPAFVLRGWQMHGGVTESELWQVRNGTNWSARMTPRSNPEVKRHGTIMEYGGGHNLTGLYIPEKTYFETHPEFFPYNSGGRVRPSERRHRTQLCFTNPEMTRMFMAELERRIRANPDFTVYRVMIEDTWEQCECKTCTRDIVLPDDGGILPYSTDRGSPFRSTQFFMWLNQLGEHLREHYPGKGILTFGYFFTAVPPEVPVAPNVSISFCPITKNSREPLSGPTNREWQRRFLSWMRITDQLTWREYFGLVGPFPRPIDVVALEDLALVNSYGVNRTYSEMAGDGRSARWDGENVWDLNALYFWTTTNGLWHPSRQKALDLREEFLRRVYGDGAEDVGEFYSLIEDAWFDLKGTSRWNDLAVKNWRKTVLRQQLTVPCRQALERAAPKVSHPKGRRMLAALRTTFEECVSGFDRMTFRGSAAKTATAPEFGLDFEHAPWNRAEALDLFLGRDGAPAHEKTVVRVLYDDRGLTIGATCFDASPENIHGREAGQPRDQWPEGDKFEVFLAGKNAGQVCYYQFAWDSRANRYDGRNRDPSWNGQWTVETRIDKDAWRSFAFIPWEDLGMSNPPDAVKAGFLRYWNHNSPSPKLLTWFGGGAHDPGDLYPITLE